MPRPLLSDEGSEDDHDHGHSSDDDTSESQMSDCPSWDPLDFGFDINPLAVGFDGYRLDTSPGLAEGMTVDDLADKGDGLAATLAQFLNSHHNRVLSSHLADRPLWPPKSSLVEESRLSEAELEAMLE